MIDDSFDARASSFRWALAPFARRSGSKRVQVAAVLCALVVATAACGDDDDASDTTAAAPGSVASGTDEPTTTGSSSEEPATTESDSDDGAASTEPTDEASSSPDLGNAPTDEGKPVRGGTLVYGIEADTANPWPGYRASFAPAGYVVISSITDPLFLPNDKSETVPHLVETAESNADFTQWTFTLRDGITFHDGTMFDAAAVKVNIDACRAAPLSRPGYSPITRCPGRRVRS